MPGGAVPTGFPENDVSPKNISNDGRVAEEVDGLTDLKFSDSQDFSFDHPRHISGHVSYCTVM